ncbi:glycosyltransferase [Luedemannella helvata]|uniref:Glycosyltransferase n=1 Tax=Luedemannella helvata TaxID=349315 RepID=A0ABN2JSF4_9ACTN
MATILMTSQGSAGDVLPFVRIGGALRRAGHRVVLISHAPFAAPARAAGLEFHPVDTDTEYARQLALTPHLMGATGPAAVAEFYRRGGFVAQSARELDLLDELHDKGDTILVGRHTSSLAVLIAAERLGAPSAWLALAPVQLLTAPVALRHYRNGLATEIDELRDRAGLPPMTDWRGWFGTVDAVIGLWPGWFDRAGLRSPARVTLAGFPLPDEPVDRATPTIDGAFAGRPLLVTGGTGRMLHPAFYPAALAAAQAAGLPTVVVTRHRDLLPDPLPPRVRWVAHAPFADVLPHVTAIIHHGGIGTLSRALIARTPQLMLADGADRPDNAARVAAAGLGSWLPATDWRPDVVAAKLRELLTAPAPTPAEPVDGDRAAATAIADLLAGEAGW